MPMMAPMIEPAITTSHRPALMPMLCWSSSVISPIAKLAYVEGQQDDAGAGEPPAGRVGEDQGDYAKGDEDEGPGEQRAASYGIGGASPRLLEVGGPGEDRPDDVEGDEHAGGGPEAVDGHRATVCRWAPLRSSAGRANCDLGGVIREWSLGLPEGRALGGCPGRRAALRFAGGPSTRGRTLSALSVIRSRASLVDGVVAGVLSSAALATLPRSSGAGAVLLTGLCALAATTTVAWRNRAPEASP